MPKGNFTEIVKSHLGEYKKNVLGISEKGKYNYKGEILLYDHILPVSEYKQNILSEYRESFWQSKFAKIDRHRYFHHLNSSQGLCINLFYPLIYENQMGEIGKLLQIPLESDLSYKFEYVSDLESPYKDSKKTNFDFSISDKGSKVYFEVKYTENVFGTAKSDSNHQEKFKQIYEPLLKDNPYIKNECKNQDFFLKNYQIMRNLIHIKEDCFVVFLIPKQNKTIYSKAMFSRDEVLTDRGRILFRVAILEDWIDHLTQIDNPKLSSYYVKFKEKYFPRHI